MEVSFLVPVYDEQASLQALHAQIAAVCRQERLHYEILFVDDGSRDESWGVISNLAREFPEVKGIRFRRNFGKAAALSAGMAAAQGQVLVMLDADLQDDPVEIPRFLAQIAAGADVVNGWKKRRLDPWHKVYPSQVFNAMVSWLTGLQLHDHNCGFKCFRRAVTGELRLYGELHRFIPVLAHARGFKVAEIEVHHRPREFGHSKYGVRRFMRGFLDLLTVKFLTGFNQRPQHFLGAVGLLFFGIGALGLSYLAGIWVLNLAHFNLGAIGQRPLLAYSVAFLLLGGQLFSLGLLAELIVAYTGKNSDTFSITETIG